MEALKASLAQSVLQREVLAPQIADWERRVYMQNVLAPSHPSIENVKGAMWWLKGGEFVQLQRPAVSQDYKHSCEALPLFVGLSIMMAFDILHHRASMAL